MVTVKINGQEIDIATEWHEVTLAQYREMERVADELNSVRILSILSGIDYDVLINFDCSQFDEKVLQYLAFMSDVPSWTELPKPEYLTIEGVQYKVPERIESTTWFQRTMMKTLATEGVTNSLRMTQLIAPAITYMMQPVLEEGKVSDKHYPSIQQKIDKLPITDVYPVASFFLSTYLTYSR